MEATRLDRGNSQILEVLGDMLPEVLVPGWHGEASVRFRIQDGHVQWVHETRDGCRRRRVDGRQRAD
jgi:hypothetical protein